MKKNANGLLKVKQDGQIAIVGLLVMVTVLAITLSVVGRSTSEIATSVKTEESSRALSAAEGGIERALYDTGGMVLANPTPSLQFTFNNNTTAEVNAFPLPDTGLALAYPNITKSSFAQFWLARPAQVDDNNVPQRAYAGTDFRIYFGLTVPTLTAMSMATRYTDIPADLPAIEVKVIFFNAGVYESKTYLYDANATRRGSNNFLAPDTCGSHSGAGENILTNNNAEEYYYCYTTVPGPSGAFSNTAGPPANYPVMVRVRVLYSSLAHPIALRPTSGSLPQQANVITSTGKIGNVQRTIRVFQLQNAMPLFFDFALFSGGIIEKNY